MNEVLKKFITLKNDIFKEKQFNKKVELNTQFIELKKVNGLEVDGNKIYKDGVKIAKIYEKFSAKKIDLEYKTIGYGIEIY